MRYSLLGKQRFYSSVAANSREPELPDKGNSRSLPDSARQFDLQTQLTGIIKSPTKTRGTGPQLLKVMVTTSLLGAFGYHQKVALIT